MLFTLPDNKDRRAAVLNACVARGQIERAPFAIEWAFNHRYLQGARTFDIQSWESGRVESTFESEDGQMFFRYEDILVQYQRMLGVLLRMDLWPFVTTANPLSINAVRDMAMAQVVLDNLVSKCPPDRWQIPLVEGLLQYGTMGLGYWVTGDVSTGIDGCIETIPPWQLIPLPVNLKRPADDKGLIRHTKRPYEALRDAKRDWKLPPASKTELQLKRVQVGDTQQDSDAPHGTDHYGTVITDEWTGDGSDGEDESTAIAEVIESWQYNETGDRVDEYTVTIGQTEVHRVSYRKSKTEDKPWVPISIARCSHVDSWYGRPWVSPLLPLNMQVEDMMEALFRNVKQMDAFPATFIPGSFGITRAQWETTETPKVFIKETDYTADPERVETVMPVNSGDTPGRTVAHGQAATDRLSGNSPLFSGDAPGRVESAAGLGVLWETMGISNIPVSTSIAHCVSRMYRSMISQAKPMLIGNTLQLHTVDDRIMGITVDRTGTIQIDSAVYPDAARVQIDVKGRNPKMIEERRQALLLMYDKQLVDKVALHWINYAQGLQLPLWDDAIVDQIRACMLRNIVQWGDGQTPVPVRAMPFDDHQIHLRVLFRAVRRPAFEHASKAVRDAFYERIADHQADLGQSSPLPPPEEAAAASAALNGEFGASAAPAGELPPQLQQMLQQAAAGQ